MYGTLRRALEARGIVVDEKDYTAEVEGKIESAGNAIRIAAIDVRYRFPVPAEKREAAERALRVHPQGCPAHQSVKDAIEITWSADIREV